MKKLIKKFLLVALLTFLIGMFVCICVSAENAEKVVNINLNGVGDVQIFVDGVYKSDAPAVLNIGLKSKVKLVASEEKFLFFTDSSNNTLSSTNEASFVVMSDTMITAHFENNSDKKVTVYYQNDNNTNQVLRMATFSLSGIDTALTEHLVKTAYKVGFSFDKWDKTVSEIKTSAGNGEKTIIIKPKYTYTNEKFAVSVIGGTIQNSSSDGMYLVNKNLVLSANSPESGKRFSHWINKDGFIVSESNEITVKVFGEELYSAVYVDEGTTASNLSKVDITAKYDPQSDSMLVTGHRFVASNCTLLTYGLLYAKEQELTASSLQLENVNNSTIKATMISNFTETNGFFTNRVYFQNVVSVRAYVIYIDSIGNIKTAYSDVLALRYPSLENIIENSSENGLVERLPMTVNYDVNSSIDFKMNLKFIKNLSMDGTVILKNITDTNEIPLDIESSGFDILKLDDKGMLYLYDTQENRLIQTGKSIDTDKFYKIELFFDLANAKAKLYINDAFSVETNYSPIGDSVLYLFPYGNETALVDKIYLSEKNYRANKCVTHNYCETKVASTCQSNGYSLYTCINCGDSYKCNYIPKNGNHTYTSKIKTGGVSLTCEVCKDTKFVSVKNPYVVLYDKSVDGSMESAYKFSKDIADIIGYQPPIADKSTNSKTRYIDASNMSMVSNFYGFTVESTKIKLYRGILVDDDTLFEVFLDELKTASLSTIISKNFALEKSIDLYNFTLFDNEKLNKNMLSSAIAQKKKAVYEHVTNAMNIDGNVYYVSNNGNDKNEGTSEETAWQTLNKVNAELENGTILSGDAILFERGSLFRITSDDKALVVKDGVTYGSYGLQSEEMPIFTTSKANYTEGNYFTYMGNNIWKLNQKVLNVGSVIFYDLNGNEIFGERKMTQRSSLGMLVAGNTLLGKNYDYFFGTYNATSYGLDIKKEQELYIYFDGDINCDIWDIEISENYPLFDVSGSENVTIDGLLFKYSASSVIEGYASNLTVENCKFYAVGGGITSYSAIYGGVYSSTVSAINLFGELNNVLIENNVFENIHHSAINVEGIGENAKFDNVKITSNIIDKAYVGIEYSSSVELLTCDIEIYENIITDTGNCDFDNSGRESVCGYIGSCAMKIGDFVGENDKVLLKNNILDRAFLSGLSGNYYFDDNIQKYRQAMILSSVEALSHTVFDANTIIDYNDQYIGVLENNCYPCEYFSTISEFFSYAEFITNDNLIILIDRPVNESSSWYD